MITVYGADWCEDTRRSRRHLRRLGVAHHYENVDEDLDALDARHLAQRRAARARRRSTSASAGARWSSRTTTRSPARSSKCRCSPTGEERERLGVQNVGDVERLGRDGRRAGDPRAGIDGAAVHAVAGAVARRRHRADRRQPDGARVYHSPGVTSLGGPGDRPDEATRQRWLTHGPLAIRDAPASGSELTSTLDGAFDALVAGRHGDPFALLGPHLEQGQLVIRAILPDRRAGAVTRDGAEPRRDGQAHARGIFEAEVPRRRSPDPYGLRVTFPAATSSTSRIRIASAA